MTLKPLQKGKTSFGQYLKNGGWKKVGKTWLQISGVLFGIGALTMAMKFRRYLKDQTLIYESETLFEQSAKSSQNYQPYQFTAKENVKFGGNIEFEFSEMNRKQK